ncbi:MAG: glycosyltransferase family 4 protein [Patescibacteria group bacterium]
MAGSLNGPLRVAFDARPVQSARGTGIGSYTIQLLRALARSAPLDLHLAWTPGEPRPYLGRPAEYWPLGREDWQEQELLPTWLEDRRAQVYHLTQNGLGWPRRSKAPLVVTLHDLIPYRLPEMVRPSYLSRFTAEVPGAAAAARRIITVSAHAKGDICAILGVDPARVTVIPSAPAAFFRPRDRRTAGLILARRYGLRGPFILYVGGYNPRKNMAGLVWAYSRIARFLPARQRLVLAGAPGPQIERLAQLAAALGVEKEVVFPGFVRRRHLPLLYAAADLFCYPSLYEGFGLPPLEAMACGTPVVASSASSMPEVLGDAAVLVHPEDLAGMGRAMLRLLTEAAAAREYRQRGLVRAGMYRWDAIAAAVVEVYQEVSGD